MVKNKIKINIRYVTTHRIFKNFIYLNFTQVLNYLFPLITFPYIVRIFNVYNYGLYVTIITISTYLSLIVDFGFGLSATRDIAKLSNNKQQINKVFNQVVTAKIYLFLLGFAAIGIFCLWEQKYTAHIYLILLALLGGIGNILFPTWFFQAMSRVDKLAKLNVLSRSIGLVMLLLLIHNNNDMFKLIIINSSVSVIIGILAFRMAVSDFNLKFEFEYSLQQVWQTIKNGLSAFTIVVLISFYTTFNILFLSLLDNNTSVAIYSVADKILNIVLSVQGVFIQAAYPVVTAAVGHTELSNKLNKMFKYNLLLGGAGCLFLLIFAKYVIIIFAGHQYDKSIKLLQILSVVPVLMTFASTLSTKLFALRAEKYQNIALLFGVVYCFIANILLIKSYSYYAVGFNFLVCELIQISLMYLFIKKVV